MKYTIVTHDNKIYHQGSNKIPMPIDDVDAIAIKHKKYGYSYMWISDNEESLTKVPCFSKSNDRIVPLHEALRDDNYVRIIQ